jgi:hypothetical protein
MCFNEFNDHLFISYITRLRGIKAGERQWLSPIQQCHNTTEIAALPRFAGSLATTTFTGFSTSFTIEVFSELTG